MFHFGTNEKVKYVFGVNPEGEMLRKNYNGEAIPVEQLIIVGQLITVDAPRSDEQIAKEIFSQEEFKLWKQHKIDLQDWKQLHKRIQDAYSADIDAEEKKVLTPAEYDLSRKILAMQEMLYEDDALSFRWRIYGGMSGASEEDAQNNISINLLFEIEECTDDKEARSGKLCSEFWKMLDVVAQRLDAELFVLDEYVIDDHRWKGDCQGNRIPGSDQYGKNHGRPCKIVEVIWEVADKTVDEVRQLIIQLQLDLDDEEFF